MNSPCILWNKAVNSGGYPITWNNNRIQYKHREIMDAKKGEVVLHRCDNPSCVNPEHLYIGSHQDNSNDMVAKNRQAKGEDCGNSKLTTDLVFNIRTYQGKLSSRKVAVLFNISKTNVLDIWKRKIWKHV